MLSNTKKNNLTSIISLHMITNRRFTDDINGWAGDELELPNFV